MYAGAATAKNRRTAFARIRVRPHAALGGALPSDLYRSSLRPYPRRLEPITYPDHFEIRRVSMNGGIKWFDQEL
jgi:hypothetical protein